MRPSFCIAPLFILPARSLPLDSSVCPLNGPSRRLCRASSPDGLLGAFLATHIGVLALAAAALPTALLTAAAFSVALIFLAGLIPLAALLTSLTLTSLLPALPYAL